MEISSAGTLDGPSTTAQKYRDFAQAQADPPEPKNALERAPGLYLVARTQPGLSSTPE